MSHFTTLRAKRATFVFKVGTLIPPLFDHFWVQERVPTSSKSCKMRLFRPVFNQCDTSKRSGSQANRQTDRQVSVQNCIKLKIAPFSPQNSIIKVSYGANLVTTGANCPGSSFGGRPAGAFTPPEISVVLQKKPPQLLIQMGF